MKKSTSGPCGLYCGACGATDCNGCLSDFVTGWAEHCQFRRCAQNRKIDFCCLCSEYPCQELHGFMNDKWPHHWTMEPNLEYIRKNGLKEWLAFQKREWSCNVCGAEIQWYQKECRCGQQLDAWDLPE